MPKFEKRNIPNYLTIIRLILVPIIFALILLEYYWAAFAFFLTANITDVLDGRIARKYNLITDWGKLMDPLADKITQISTISALIIKGIIPFWILAVLTLKELIMISVAFVLYKKKVVQFIVCGTEKLQLFYFLLLLFFLCYLKEFLNFLLLLFMLFILLLVWLYLQELCMEKI